jgi:hypothetical protein
MLVSFCRARQCHILEDSNCHILCCETLRSHIVLFSKIQQVLVFQTAVFFEISLFLFYRHFFATYL